MVNSERFSGSTASGILTELNIAKYETNAGITQDQMVDMIAGVQYVPGNSQDAKSAI